ncbi:hypothetical protein BJF89_16920 [Corynebacterium sp. CNJ-954]|nr:hypothetical protein BJF89_16920 [Corynebacterium sp. CNJ-954]
MRTLPDAGQQAGVCLACELVRKTRILLVDEGAASLDQKTERVISDAIADYDGTVLISLHRTETLSRTVRALTLT